MKFFRKAILLMVFICIFKVIQSDESHKELKESKEWTFKDIMLSRIKNKERARVARHVEVVTENLVAHIVQMMERKYPSLRKQHKMSSNKTMPNLKRKLKQYLKNRRAKVTTKRVSNTTLIKTM